MLGLFGLFVIHANYLKDYFRENVEITVHFMDNAREADILRMQQLLEQKEAVKSTQFLHRDKAKEELIEDLGEDFVEILGYNPLPHTLKIYLHADYAVIDTIRNLQTEIEANRIVRETGFQEILVENIDKNIQLAGFIFLGFALLFMIICITLINNTIRLTLYSKRFLIKSMQLVGATQFFIRKPFIGKSIIHGIIGSILALLLLSVSLYLLFDHFPGLIEIQDFIQIGILYIAIFIIGFIISGISSYLAVGKYIKMKLDDLY